MKRDIFHYQLKDLFAIVDSGTTFMDENNDILKSSESTIEKYTNCYNDYHRHIPY